MSSSATSSVPARTRRTPSPVNVPSTVASTPCRAQRATTSSACAGGTASTIRSCASLSQISHAASPGYFSGARRTSTSAPTCSAISPTADDSPPAPQSVMSVYRPQQVVERVDQQLLGDRVADLHAGAGDVAGGGVHRRAGERRAAQAVASGAPAEHHDEVAGLCAGHRRSIGGDRRCTRRRPTGWRCTPGRRAPRRRRWAARSCCRSRPRRRSRPSAMSRGCSTPSGRSAAGRSAGPKHRMSVMAIGRCDVPITSRMTPPTPVLAPPNGSMADGWLCVSAFTASVVPGANETMPALPTNELRTNGASIESVASRSWRSSGAITRAVVGGDRGAERLVRAVLAPRLGEHLQLDLRRLAPRSAVVGDDRVQLGRVECQAAGDVQRGELVGVERGHRDRRCGLGAGGRGVDERRLDRRRRPAFDHLVGQQPPGQQGDVVVGQVAADGEVHAGGRIADLDADGGCRVAHGDGRGIGHARQQRSLQPGAGHVPGRPSAAADRPGPPRRSPVDRRPAQPRRTPRRRRRRWSAH